MTPESAPVPAAMPVVGAYSVDPGGDIAALTALLHRLAPPFTRLHDLFRAQRTAIVEGDLDRLLALLAEQEEVSARVAGLEQKRQRLQASLETALGVSGLRGIAGAAPVTPAARATLLDAIETVHDHVVALQTEGQGVAGVLHGAIETSRRTRTLLTRMGGLTPTYTASGVAPAGGTTSTSS